MTSTAKSEWVEQELEHFLDLHGSNTSAHHKSVLRDMFGREWDFWENEERRVLKDSNRYHDDI